MIVLPVPNAGPDVTWIVIGFLLGFIGLMLLVGAWWNEALRNDRTDTQIAALWKAIPRAAIPAAAGPTTEPLEAPQPAEGPRTMPEELEAVVAVTADDWRKRWDEEIAEMRARWDGEATA